MTTGWPAVEGEFVRLFLQRRLALLGLVETDASGSAFCLTPLGAHALSLADAPELVLPEPSPIIVQPDFELLVDTSGPSFGIVAQIDSLAELIRFDRVAQFRLTRSALYRALEAGQKAADIIAFLESHSQAPLPQNVAYSLADWARGYGRVTIRRGATVLECDSPEQLDALLTQLPDALVRLAPAWARVAPGAEGEVAAALAQEGPFVTIDHQAPPEQAYTVDGDMRIVPGPGRWHFYHRHLLSLVADPEQPDSPLAPLRLSPDSVRRATQEGYTPAYVEGLIAQGAQRPLTPRQLFILRGWLGRYGAARLGPAELLLTDEATARELLGVDEARECVIEEIRPGVLLLRSDQAARLRQLLADASVKLLPPLDAARDGRQRQGGDPEPAAPPLRSG